MSFIPRSSTSQTQPTRTISVSSIFTFPTSSSSSFSSSSTPPPPQILFTASCALLFSQISGSTSSFSTKAKEVLFGHIFSPPPPPFSSSSPTSTIGSNKILIPIRIRISNPASASYEIIRQIQEQFSAGKAFFHGGDAKKEGFDFAVVANDNCYVRDCRGKIEKGDFGAVGEWVEDFSASASAASSASADGGSGSGNANGSAGTVKLLRPRRGKKNPIGTSNSNEELEEEEELELERSNAVYIKAIPLPLPPTQQEQQNQQQHQQQKIQIQISARSDVHSQAKLSEMSKILNEIWEKMGREGLVTATASGMGMVGRGENKRKISMAEGFF